MQENVVPMNKNWTEVTVCQNLNNVFLHNYAIYHIASSYVFLNTSRVQEWPIEGRLASFAFIIDPVFLVLTL